MKMYYLKSLLAILILSVWCSDGLSQNSSCIKTTFPDLKSKEYVNFNKVIDDSIDWHVEAAQHIINGSDADQLRSAIYDGIMTINKFINDLDGTLRNTNISKTNIAASIQNIIEDFRQVVLTVENLRSTGQIIFKKHVDIKTKSDVKLKELQELIFIYECDLEYLLQEQQRYADNIEKYKILQTYIDGFKDSHKETQNNIKKIEDGVVKLRTLIFKSIDSINPFVEIITEYVPKEVSSGNRLVFSALKAMGIDLKFVDINPNILMFSKLEDKLQKEMQEIEKVVTQLSDRAKETIKILRPDYENIFFDTSNWKKTLDEMIRFRKAWRDMTLKLEMWNIAFWFNALNGKTFELHDQLECFSFDNISGKLDTTKSIILEPGTKVIVKERRKSGEDNFIIIQKQDSLDSYYSVEKSAIKILTSSQGL